MCSSNITFLLWHNTYITICRRKLGRALDKTIRVSCVGVYNADGANELLVAIKKKVVSLRSAPIPSVPLGSTAI